MENWLSRIKNFAGGGDRGPIVFTKDDAPQPTPITTIKKPSRGIVSPIPVKQDEGFFSRLFGLQNSGPIVFEAEATPTPMPTPTATPRPTPKPVGTVLGTSTSQFKELPSSIPGYGSVQRSPNSDRFLEETVLPITREAGIPDAVAAGQFAAEGRLGGLGASRNNFFNIAAFDSNVDAARYYETPEQGVEAYASLIQRKYGPAFEYADDPVRFMQEVERLGYAGDPATYGERSDSGFQSYTQFIMNTPEFQSFLDSIGF